MLTVIAEIPIQLPEYSQVQVPFPAGLQETGQVMKAIDLAKVVFICIAANGMSACSTFFDKQVEWETVEPEHYPTLTAVGYAPIAAQLGESDSMREIMAMKASKLDAYKELAEQVYGQRINGDESLANLVLSNSQLKASVEGVIRGAKVIKTYPVGEDTYATELELDMQRVYEIYLTTAKPQRIKQIKYY